MSQRRIVELDGLRGLAILLVLLVHFGSILPAQAPAERWLQSLCAAGWSGVDLFFVLSGFLITGILLESRSDSGYFRKFFARRILRIFPLYYGVLFAVFVMAPVWLPGIIDDRLWASQWSLWFYVSNLQVLDAGPESMRGTIVNFAHFWSLAIEEQFYLVWPFVVYCLTPRRLTRVCLVLILTGIPIRLWALQTYGPYAPYYLTPCRLETLAWGAMCAVAVRNYSAVALQHIAQRGFYVGGTGILILFLWRGGLRFNDPVATILGQTAFAMCFSGLLIITLNSHQTQLGAWLRWPLLQTLGKYSYGIYVFHGLLQVFLWSFADRLTTAAPNYFVALISYVTLCGGASYLLARISWEYEKIFLNLKPYFDYDFQTTPAPATAES